MCESLPLHGRGRLFRPGCCRTRFARNAGHVWSGEHRMPRVEWATHLLDGVPISSTQLDSLVHDSFKVNRLWTCKQMSQVLKRTI